MCGWQTGHDRNPKDGESRVVGQLESMSIYDGLMRRRHGRDQDNQNE